MSHVIPLDEINQYLPVDKLQVQSADHDTLVRELEDSAQEVVFSALRKRYSTSTWTTPTTIPQLVRTCIALFVSGWVYDRQFSEEVATISYRTNSYGQRRLEEAYRLLDGLLDGTYELSSTYLIDTDDGEPAFLASDPRFEVGTRF